MATLIQADFLTAVRATLDGDATDWPSGILLAACASAASDLERLGLPREYIYDKTLKFAYARTDAAVVFTSFDVAYPISELVPENGALYPIVEFDTEQVSKYDDATVIYTRDTDYTIDYANGTLTALSTGSITEGDTCYVSFTKDKKCLSIYGMDYINIESVEYPSGQVPQRFVNWSIFGNMLTLTSQEANDSSQVELTEGYHVLLRTTRKHTIPGTYLGGTWDDYVDYVMVNGTSAYAMLFRALAYFQYGREALDSNTTLWTDFDTRITEALAYLAAGEAYLTTINVADKVPENYAAYAEQCMSMVNQLRQRAEIYANTGVAAYQMGNSLINSAEKRLSTFHGDILSRAHARSNKFSAPTQQIAR